MASKVALAKRAERDRQELDATLNRIEQALDEILLRLDRWELEAAKPAPAKRDSRQKRTGLNA